MPTNQMNGQEHMESVHNGIFLTYREKCEIQRKKTVKLSVVSQVQKDKQQMSPHTQTLKYFL